jgi:hypothetical protein
MGPVGSWDGLEVVQGVQLDGIAHFPAVAGGLVDAAMPLIGRGRSAAWAGRSGRGQDAAATKTQQCPTRRTAARRETSEIFSEAGRDFEELAELSRARA